MAVTVAGPVNPIQDLLYASAFAVAVVGYDRSESLWVAVGSLAAFEAAVGVAPLLF